MSRGKDLSQKFRKSFDKSHSCSSTAGRDFGVLMGNFIQPFPRSNPSSEVFLLKETATDCTLTDFYF